MKRKIIICLILSLMLLSCACSKQDAASGGQKPGSNTTSTTEVTPNPQNTQNADISIKASPPEGWEPRESAGILINYQKSTASFLLKKEPYFDSKDLDGVVEEAKEAFDRSFDNVKYIGETEKIQVDGKDALKIYFTTEMMGMKMKFAYVYLFVGKDVYAITFGDTTESFDTHTADFKKILDSLRFE